MRRSIFAILSLLLIAADPLEGDKFLEKADEKFEQAVERTQQAFAKSMREAYETRLKTYRSILAAATKAGDFDRATAVKAKIEEIEAERDAVADGPAGKEKAAKIPNDAVAFGGHHYQIVDEQRTWHIAKRRCEEMGGHLASINSPEEEAFVFGLCKQASKEIWLGATDEEEEGRWEWVDGQAMKLPSAQLNNSPLGFFRQGVEHHLFYHPQEAIFTDYIGSYRALFLCEWDK